MLLIFHYFRKGPIYFLLHIYSAGVNSFGTWGGTGADLIGLWGCIKTKKSWQPSLQSHPFTSRNIFIFAVLLMWFAWRGFALSLQLLALFEDFPTCTMQQQQLGVHTTSYCLSRCFRAVGELAHTQRSGESKKGKGEKKMRDSVRQWVRGMPNYNHLWWYNHSSVKLHSGLIYPLSLA